MLMQGTSKENPLSFKVQRKLKLLNAKMETDVNGWIK